MLAWTLLWMLASATHVWTTGCTTAPTLNNSDRLMARPDFDIVRRAAPEWARDALHTINKLEHTIERGP